MHTGNTCIYRRIAEEQHFLGHFIITDRQTINYSSRASNTINYSSGASKTNLALTSAPKERLLLEKTIDNFDTIHEGYSKVAGKMSRFFLLRGLVFGWIQNNCEL